MTVNEQISGNPESGSGAEVKKVIRRGNMKRNIVMAAVLLFVCAAVYLNYSYSNRLGEADPAMAAAEDAAIASAEAEYAAAEAAQAAEYGQENVSQTLAEEELAAESVSPYFAAARLTRQQSRDEALALLETAASSEGASQETIDSAMASIATMAEWSLQEAQVENLLLAKDFADCVVYISGENISVAVPAPVEGLSEAAVARITDVITAETDFTASQLKLIEVKD